MLKVKSDAAVDLDGRVLDTFLTLEDVLIELKDRKVSPIEPPEEDMSKMPDDLSKLTNDDVAALFSKILAYQNFVATELALASAELTQEKNRLTYVKASLKKQIKDKDELETHPEMLQAKVAKQKAEQRHLMVEALNRVITNNLKVVSRSIELRRLDFDGHHRETSIGRGSIQHASKDIKWAKRESKD